jgi:hypothetical protein
VVDDLWVISVHAVATTTTTLMVAALTPSHQPNPRNRCFQVRSSKKNVCQNSLTVVFFLTPLLSIQLRFSFDAVGIQSPRQITANLSSSIGSRTRFDL